MPIRDFLQLRAVHGFLEAERSIYALVKRQADAVLGPTGSPPVTA